MSVPAFTLPVVAAPFAALGACFRPGIIAAVYFALASTTMYLTRFDGGLAFIWVANALLVAELVHLPRHRWLPTLACAAAASFAATSLFGLGVTVAPLMAICAAVEAALGATLLLRFGAGRVRLDSLYSTATFALAVGGLAPLVTAFPAAAAATLVTGASYWTMWLHSLFGHSLGTITFAPMMLMLLDGRLARSLASTDWRRWPSIAIPVALCIAVTALSFGQSRYPMLFLPMLPLVYMSFRFGQLGAAFTVLTIALIGGVLTATGHGPVQLIAISTGQRMQFFQFYLAAAVLTALPVAAELSHRSRLFRALQHSEARFRMLTQRSSDVIVSVDRHGVIDYVSPSIVEMMGYAPDALIGKRAGSLIHRDDHPAVLAGHLRALADPEVTGSYEYRGRHANGTYRWFESSVRGVVGEHGAATGAVSAVRDITRRKMAEQALASAATTDPLTGLPNRRAFVGLLEERIAAAARGADAGFCALVDFDHFKQINDRLGHDAGDRALQAFARVATEFAGPGEMIARIGGEEFGIILQRATSSAAQRRCDALRDAVAALTLTTRDGAPIVVTVSIGVAAIDNGTMPAVMAAADTALYRAKADGRNRVAFAAGTWNTQVALAS